MEKVNSQQLMLTHSFEGFHLQDDLPPLQEILRHSTPVWVFLNTFKSEVQRRPEAHQQLAVCHRSPWGMQQQHCVMRDAGAGAGAHFPATSLSSTSSSPKPPGSLCKHHCSLHGGLTNTKLMNKSWGLQPRHIISPPAWAHPVTALSGSSAYGLRKAAPLSQARRSVETLQHAIPQP